jgi:hypothetical protein
MSFTRKFLTFIFVIIPLGCIAFAGLFWVGIELLEGSTAYVSGLGLKNSKEKEQALHLNIQETASETPETTLFSWIHANRSSAYIIIGVIGLIWIMSIYRKRTWNEQLTGTALVIYSALLALASILEIWYFLSLGMGDAAWFISEPPLFFIVINGIILIVCTFVQIFSIMHLSIDMVSEWNLIPNDNWMLWGILLSVILYAAGRYLNILPEEREWLIVTCLFLGQIPRVINTWQNALRDSFMLSTGQRVLLIAFQLIVAVGTICLTALMLIALVVGLVVWGIMYAMSHGGGGESKEEIITLNDGTELRSLGNGEFRGNNGRIYRDCGGGTFEKQEY